MNKYKAIYYDTKDKLNLLAAFLLSDHTENESWKELDDGSGLYFVSDKGRVLSLYNNFPKILKAYDCNGYSHVRINGKDQKIHRLVANAFIDNPDNLPIVHHKDHNKKNNLLSNIQWSTYSNNTQEYYKLKRDQKEGDLNSKER